MIPGFLISILTFPGVIAHEAAHKFFCDRAGVPIKAVCYFRFGNPAGFVIHGPAEKAGQSFLITIGPLLVNSLLCVLLTFSAFIYRRYYGGGGSSLIYWFFMWLGIAIGMHAFPSNEDAASFAASVKRMNRKGILYLVAIPFAGLVALANVLKIFWFDLIYAVGLSYILPNIIFK